MSRGWRIAGAAATWGLLGASGPAWADWLGLEVELHATVMTAEGTKSVYRVYAKFTQNSDTVVFWGDNGDGVMNVQTERCSGELGGPFFDPPLGGNTAPSQASIDLAPDTQWDTFATIGINKADQGQTPLLAAGFRPFAAGMNQWPPGGSLPAIFFPPPVIPAQCRADFAGDGDAELRVLLMQLTTNPEDGVSGTIGLILFDFVPNNQSLLSFSAGPAVGRCCLPEGSCAETSEGDCHSAHGMFLGCGGDCSTCAPVRISEVRLDQPGADDDEYVEIQGPPGFNLGAFRLVVLGDSAGGMSGVVELSQPLPATIPADGHLLVAKPTFGLAPPSEVDLFIPPVFLENADNVTYLLVTKSTSPIGADLDVDNNGVLNSMPWDSVVDAVGILDAPLPPIPPTEEWAYGASLGFVNVGPDPGAAFPGHIYRCSRTGAWVFGAYSEIGGDDTPGAPNAPCTPPCPGNTNQDGVVDVGDLVNVILAWGSNDPDTDVDGNGVVAVGDLVLVVLSWGPC